MLSEEKETDLAPNGLPFGAKSIGKRGNQIEIWFEFSRFRIDFFACTSVSRDIGVSFFQGPISAPLKPLEHRSTIVLEGLRGALNWAPIACGRRQWNVLQPARRVHAWTTFLAFPGSCQIKTNFDSSNQLENILTNFQ